MIQSESKSFPFAHPPSPYNNHRCVRLHPSRACILRPVHRNRRSSYPTHPPLRARPAADAARPLSTGSVETSDGEQPPSWIPHPSAARPDPPSHATGHSAFSKRCSFLLADQRALLRIQRRGPSPRDDQRKFQTQVNENKCFLNRPGVKKIDTI